MTTQFHFFIALMGQLLFLLFLPINLSASVTSQNTDFQIQPGRGIGKVLLNATRQEVHRLLGKPNQESSQGNLRRDFYQAENRHYVSLLYEQDKVIQIGVNAPKFATPDGLSTASAVQQIKQMNDVQRCCTYYGNSIYYDGVSDLYDDISRGIAYKLKYSIATDAPIAIEEIIVHLPNRPVLPNGVKPVLLARDSENTTPRDPTGSYSDQAGTSLEVKLLPNNQIKFAWSGTLRTAGSVHVESAEGTVPIKNGLAIYRLKDAVPDTQCSLVMKFYGTHVVIDDDNKSDQGCFVSQVPISGLLTKLSNRPSKRVAQTSGSSTAMPGAAFIQKTILNSQPQFAAFTAPLHSIAPDDSRYPGKTWLHARSPEEFDWSSVKYAISGCRRTLAVSDSQDGRKRATQRLSTLPSHRYSY